MNTANLIIVLIYLFYLSIFNFCSFICIFIFRLERVITRMMRTLPVLSSSEKKMMQELEAMQTHIPVFLNQLRQIKEKEKLTSQVNTVFKGYF